MIGNINLRCPICRKMRTPILDAMNDRVYVYCPECMEKARKQERIERIMEQIRNEPYSIKIPSSFYIPPGSL